MANVQMQARSSSNGQLYTWIASSVDFIAAGFPGPGSALDIAVSMRPPGTGGGGGGLTVTGSPSAGYVPTWNGSGAVWASTGAFDITSFSTTTLVETGQAITPAFTAAENRTPTSLVMTNNANAESRNVVGTPTSFSTLLSVTRSVPNQTYTYTLTGGDGIGTDVATVTITWGQRNFAGLVTAGASLATLVAAAAYTALGTNGSFSFTLNSTGGTQRAQFAFPSRYGAITSIKDGATGLGVGVILLGTTSRTNAQGYAENYDQYEFSSAYTGSKTFNVVD